MNSLIKPPALNPGSTLGIFTPSWPAHAKFPEKFRHGIAQLEESGYQITLGSLTDRYSHEGYRSGSPEERAQEFMELITNPDIDGLMATIGGSNSASLIPHLDFDSIRRHPKVVCGYSDVTSLHLALMRHANLSTFYGPAVVPSFGEWPQVLPYTRQQFQWATQGFAGPQVLVPPETWTRDRVPWERWQERPRKLESNSGWRCLSAGVAEGPLLAFNLNTLCSNAGTDHWPDFRGALLAIEEMDSNFAQFERNLRHLQLLGVFDRVAGLILSKPEFPDALGAPFQLHDLFREVIGPRAYPVVTDFDCGHCAPMLTLGQGTQARLEADAEATTLTLLESMVR